MERRRLWVRFAVAAGLGIAAGALIRYQVFDTNTLNWLCEGGRGPWWCTLRRGAKTVLQWQGLSLTTLVVAVYACLTGRLSAILVAGGLGAAGLFLYAPELSAAGLLLAALRLLRPLDCAWPTLRLPDQSESS